MQEISMRAPTTNLLMPITARRTVVIWIREKLFPDSIHVLDFVDVGHINHCLSNIAIRASSFFKHPEDVLQALAGVFRTATCHRFIGDWIHRHLTGHEHKLSDSGCSGQVDG